MILAWLPKQNKHSQSSAGCQPQNKYMSNWNKMVDQSRGVMANDVYCAGHVSGVETYHVRQWCWWTLWAKQKVKGPRCTFRDVPPRMWNAKRQAEALMGLIGPDSAGVRGHDSLLVVPVCASEGRSQLLGSRPEWHNPPASTVPCLLKPCLPLTLSQRAR